MRRMWNNKFLFWNFVILLVLKAGIAPVLQSASLLAGDTDYSASEIITSTNAARSANSASSLKESSVLNIAAAQKLDDMVRNQYFAHVSPAGVTPWHWFQVNGYRYSYAGENLAMGYPTAETTVDAWMKSPSHRSNILNKTFREIGVATKPVTISGDSGVLVVQFFGAPLEPKTLSENDASGIGFSESSAEESPLVTPKVLPVKLAQVSPTVPPGPRTSSIQRESVSKRIMDTLDRSFNVYAYLVALWALSYVLFREFRREFVFKAALHILVFLLAVFVPVLTVATGGKIF